MIFEELLPVENCIDHFFESHPPDQPIIFFGAGFALERILLAFEKKNLTITCICDNDQRKQGTRFRTYEILSLEDSVQRYPDAVYVITPPSIFGR